MRAFACLAPLLALASGCMDLSDDGATPQEQDGSGGVVDAVRQTSERQLGSQSGSAMTPSAFEFTVTVPPGGASSVGWEIAVDNGMPDGSSMEGPGCSDNGVGNVNLVVQAGLSRSIRGSCGDLSEGDHSFTVHVRGPAPAFVATVTGRTTE